MAGGLSALRIAITANRNAFSTAVRRLRDDGLPLFVSVYPEAGSVNADRLQGQSSTMVDLGTGEIIEVQVGGGAGYGPPVPRPADAVAEDRINGYLGG